MEHDYTMVSGPDSEDFIAAVNARLALGWETCGGLATSTRRTPLTLDPTMDRVETVFHQAMVKRVGVL